MAGSGLLRERDVLALTAVIEEGLRDDPGELMPWAVLDRLQQLIPSGIVQFDELDLQGHEHVTEQFVEDGERRLVLGTDPDGASGSWEVRPSFLPYSYSVRTGDLSSVLRWSDFYTQSELKNHPFYHYVPHTIKYGLFVPLPRRGTRSLRLALFRSNRDFSERDRLVLQLLRPHLNDVYLDAERRRHGIPHVSRREREVLQLASQGYSNADIARVLFISVATVRKHMEHIFDRTGVRTRSAAAAVALPSVSPFRGLPPQAGT
jgi:DNA-binding CsgD family transcriptional regulator